VIGDFLASGLAEGLETVFAENPAIRIADRAKGSSGLVRDDFYDWPASIKDVLETEKPVAVVVMLGSNDRQSMQVGDNREQLRSDAWTKQYEQRAEALATEVKAGKVPFLWVGMPSFKISKMTSDMLAFNDIYRSVAEKAGGEFVDIWDGFVDENGNFIVTGSDVNGQQVRLRSADGINLTPAGRRKLAFYVEKPVRRILGTQASPDLVRLDPGSLVGLALPANPVEHSQPISLSDPNLDGGSVLLGAGAPPMTLAKSPRDLLVEKGEMAPAPAGRVDDYRLPRPR
jgi:hypothetical protein